MREINSMRLMTSTVWNWDIINKLCGGDNDNDTFFFDYIDNKFEQFARQFVSLFVIWINEKNEFYVTDRQGIVHIYDISFFSGSPTIPSHLPLPRYAQTILRNFEFIEIIRLRGCSDNYKTVNCVMNRYKSMCWDKK